MLLEAELRSKDGRLRQRRYRGSGGRFRRPSDGVQPAISGRDADCFAIERNDSEGQFGRLECFSTLGLVHDNVQTASELIRIDRAQGITQRACRGLGAGCQTTFSWASSCARSISSTSAKLLAPVSMAPSTVRSSAPKSQRLPRSSRPSGTSSSPASSKRLAKKPYRRQAFLTTAAVAVSESVAGGGARKAVAVTVYGIAPGAETAWAGRASTTPRPARSAVLSG